MGGRKDICGARIGTSFEAQRWLSLDTCGFLGITLSFSAHAFAFLVIVCHLIAGSLIANAIFLLLYMPAVMMALSSLYIAWTTDPGSVPLGARPLVTVKRATSGEIASTGTRRNRAMRRCHKCNDNFKPARAHHDSVTGRCIVKFDHFCPWVGNAVGAMNHKFFVLFIGYTMVSCLFSLCLIGLRTWHCGFPIPSGSDENNNQKNYPQECKGWNESYSSLLLLIISVVFFIFTACMLFENLEAIETNASKIARMKMRVGQGGTELSRVTEEFNEMFGGESNEVAWHWFFPTQVEFPRGMKKVVLGYEWDETFDAVPYQESNCSNDLETCRDIESSGRIELTSAPSSATSTSSNKEKNSEHESPNDMNVTEGDEEGSFSGTPVTRKESPAKLVKRANSRDRESRIDPLRNGTLT